MTHSRWQGGRLARALAASLILAGAITAIGLARALAAPAAGCQTGSGMDATLTEHWDGGTWTVVPSPAPGTVSLLRSVRGTSPSDVWAVGEYSDGTMNKTLTMHWDGH